MYGELRTASVVVRLTVWCWRFVFETYLEGGGLETVVEACSRIADIMVVRFDVPKCSPAIRKVLEQLPELQAVDFGGCLDVIFQLRVFVWGSHVISGLILLKLATGFSDGLLFFIP